MQNFDSAFKKICELVNDFKKNEQLYLSPKYSEAQVRQDFIDKFFESLGWDVYHKIQKNPYEQEVKVEKGVSVEKSHKRADYAFYISPEFRQPKFFAEAKKPSRSLKNANDYFQTIRYGWSANTPVAVLTDFEEFHILDCRLKPDVNQVLQTPSHKCFRYTDYAVEEKFKEIYFLFSRDSVAAQSLSKYSDTLPKLKGKKVAKSAYQSIDDDFLEYIDKVREILAKAFKKNDSSLTSEELTEATQRTVDRLVFIRFLEDKQIEPDFIVSEFVKNENPFKRFISVCRTLDAKYNGIVFKKHFIDEQDFRGPEQNTFKKICDEISHENSPYDFNAIPVHILGSIYERFLGKVVNATAQRVKVEEKPEVRKAGGVYYTPKYIVDYIVENTVGKIIYNCHSDPALSSLHATPVSSLHVPGRDLALKNSNGKTPAEISALRFADIACGSGSFLIGVFETLLKYHTEYYQSRPGEAKKDGCIYKDGQWVLSIKQKQKILVNNIYGVDIDPQAVEVTQLSLALKMLEDETTATANEMQALFHEKILPDLSKNIVCGNSLIGTDILQGNMFASEEEKKLNPMDFETVFPHVFCHSRESGNPEKNGFDAIVGNPPWVSLTGKFRNDILSEKAIVYLIDKYKGNTYMPNLYEYFISKGLNLIKEKGYFSLIVPDRMGFNSQFVKLRNRILNKFIIEELLYKVDFPNIITDTLIFRISKGPNINYKIKVGEYKKEFQIKYRDDYLENDGNKFTYEVNFNVEKLIKKVFSSENNDQLKNLIYSTSGFGGKSEEISKNRLTDRQIKIYRGRSIDRYIIKEVFYFEFKRTNITGRTTDVEKLGAKEKVLLRKTGFPLFATFDNSSIFPEQSLYFLYNNNSNLSLKYFTAIINSKLFQFIYINKLVTNKDSTPQLKKVDLDIFPIRTINFQSESEKRSHDLIVSLVDRMLTAKKQLHESKTDKDKTYYERRCADLDRQIDAEVYKLYNLTEDEIRIIEGESK